VTSPTAASGSGDASEPSAWLPPGAADIDCFTPAGLDLARCLVALGWTLADTAASPVGHASVTRG
jgi:hypothetical protein